MLLITNRNNSVRNDRFEFYLHNACKNTHVNIAVAFFTDYKVIEKMLDNNCTIDMIVRLNDGTSPEALGRIYQKSGIRVRYFTSTHFHPKLYLIPHTTAFIGSSNLTNCALNTNNEINLQIDYEQDQYLFEELDELFKDYWTQAVPLDGDSLEKFEKCMTGRSPGYSDYSNIIGNVEFSNVQNENKKDKKKLFINDFKRNYLDYVKAFKQAEEYYMQTSKRRWENLPLRIELDRFLWWIGETQYSRDEWQINERYSDDKIRKLIIGLKPDFIKSDIKWLSHATENYEILNNSLDSTEKIDKLNNDNMFDILSNIYSFHDSLRYHKGGIETLKQDFYKVNDLDKIKETIKYLLFDKKNYIERLYDCIYGDYKLLEFGESSIKELYGYVNKEEYPIFNGRIRKSMEWLGFGKF